MNYIVAFSGKLIQPEIEKKGGRREEGEKREWINGNNDEDFVQKNSIKI